MIVEKLNKFQPFESLPKNKSNSERKMKSQLLLSP